MNTGSLFLLLLFFNWKISQGCFEVIIAKGIEVRSLFIQSLGTTIRVSQKLQPLAFKLYFPDFLWNWKRHVNL